MYVNKLKEPMCYHETNRMESVFPISISLLYFFYLNFFFFVSFTTIFSSTLYVGYFFIFNLYSFLFAYIFISVVVGCCFFLLLLFQWKIAGFYFPPEWKMKLDGGFMYSTIGIFIYIYLYIWTVDVYPIAHGVNRIRVKLNLRKALVSL